jgi:hypothetical protein
MLIPLVGTQDFWESVDRGELRPNLRLRELDGETICYSNLADREARMTDFMRTLSTRPGELINRWRMLWSTLCRIRNSRSLNPLLWYVICASNFRFFSFARAYERGETRSYLAGRDPLDPQYLEFPPDITAADRRRYFDPIMITDARAQLAAWLQPYAKPVVSRARSIAIPVHAESG